MKTKKWMLSVAMFAIAIFGAFAISSTAPLALYYHSDDLIDPCKNVSVACDGGQAFQCQVDKGIIEGTRDVWQNSICTVEMTHSADEVLPEIPEP